MAEFDDIRPYNDEEVENVLERLYDDEEFLDAIIKLTFPTFGRYFAGISRYLVKLRIKKEIKNVRSVKDFQDVIESHMKPVLDRTVAHLSVSGLDKIDRNNNYLFVSNHRDITMDPALVNWSLYHSGFSTLRIAIGDNLLTKPFASDLMRLNKSFIVNRSAKGPREKLRVAKQLSRYIRHSLSEDKENIWIAQREGRAKDGLDKTNSAVIGMLGLSKEKSEEYSEFIKELKIVPTSISYEYDPCDIAKARELYEKESTGSYTKEQHEDVQSIAAGIVGDKGHVHISFGHPISADCNDVDEVTRQIDKQITSSYVLHPTNCIAYEMLEKSAPDVAVGETQEKFNSQHFQEERAQLQARIDKCEPEWRETFLRGYANPVYVHLALAKESIKDSEGGENTGVVSAG